MNRLYFTNLFFIFTFFCQIFCNAQQKENISKPYSSFKLYQNDTLAATNSRMLEHSSRNFTAKEVLDRDIKWVNPYPTVQNNQMQGFDYSKIGKVAAKVIYPIIFTSPKEFTEIQTRLNSTKIGGRLKELDKLKSRTGILGKAHQSLLSSDTVKLESNFPYADFANKLAIQGLLAQLKNDKQDIANTCKDAGNFLQVWMRSIDAIPPVQGREMMIKEQVYNHASMAKLFDFTATGMSAEHKKSYMEFMLRETTCKYGDGMQLPNHWRRWNHIASALAYPLGALSIENEKGYDKRIYDRGLEVLQDYLTYSFSPDGMNNEGITYTFGPFADDLLHMTAAAKRGQPNFWGNPHFRTTLTVAFKDQLDIFYFTESKEGRTGVKLV